MIRFFDITLSLLGVIFLSPLLLCISICILFSSGRPILFLGKRVGKNFKEFNQIKFRTMELDADKKREITVGFTDSRITKLGGFLRKYKLDELPQLFNVLVGDMSLVGPRPEIQKFVDKLPIEHNLKFKIRPGVTDWASIYFLNIEGVVCKFDNPELDYINIIMPLKLQYNLIYIQNYCLKEYFKIIFITLFKIFKIPYFYAIQPPKPNEKNLNYIHPFNSSSTTRKKPVQTQS